MISKTKVILAVLVCSIQILLLVGCTTTRKNVVGAWRNGPEFVVLNTDSTFLIVTKLESSSDTIKGKWVLDHKVVSLAFDKPEEQRRFMGCAGLQVFSRYKMIRPYTCLEYYPAKPVFYYK